MWVCGSVVCTSQFTAKGSIALSSQNIPLYSSAPESSVCSLGLAVRRTVRQRLCETCRKVPGNWVCNKLGPEVALNLCRGLVVEPAGSVIYGGDDGLGNGVCCRGGFQWTWYNPQMCLSLVFYKGIRVTVHWVSEGGKSLIPWEWSSVAGSSPAVPWGMCLIDMSGVMVFLPKNEL